jgi:hypothetical protein
MGWREEEEKGVGGMRSAGEEDLELLYWER